MRCPTCSSEVPPSVARCPSCGSAIDQTGTISIAREGEESPLREDLSPADRSAVESLPSGSALLIVQRGPQAGSRFLLDQEEVMVGRHPDSDIFLDDVTVSRRHAIFRRSNKTFSVEDAGSLNGTYVNRDRADSYVLSNGDEVQIGKFRLIFFTSVGA